MWTSEFQSDWEVLLPLQYSTVQVMRQEDNDKLWLLVFSVDSLHFKKDKLLERERTAALWLHFREKLFLLCNGYIPGSTGLQLSDNHLSPDSGVKCFFLSAQLMQSAYSLVKWKCRWKCPLMLRPCYPPQLPHTVTASLIHKFHRSL